MAHPWVAPADAIVAEINAASLTVSDLEAKRKYQGPSGKRNTHTYSCRVCPNPEDFFSPTKQDRAYSYTENLNLIVWLERRILMDDSKVGGQLDEVLSVFQEIVDLLSDGDKWAGWSLQEYGTLTYDDERIWSSGVFQGQIQLNLRRVV